MASLLLLWWTLTAQLGTLGFAPADRNHKPLRTGTYYFTCGRFPSVSFQFPIFKDWEPSGVMETENGCMVHLSWPEHFEYEFARAITVTQINDPQYAQSVARAQKAQEFFMQKVRCYPAQKNGQGIFYGFAFDPERYVANFTPPQGHWDYLQFYGPRQGVRIALDADTERRGFAQEAWLKDVVGTFSIGDKVDRPKTIRIVGVVEQMSPVKKSTAHWELKIEVRKVLDGWFPARTLVLHSPLRRGLEKGKTYELEIQQNGTRLDLVERPYRPLPH